MEFGKKVGCGEFVKRQTPESGHSHFEGTWEELEEMVAACMDKPQQVRPGYKDGVVLVDLTNGYDLRRFKSALVKLDHNTKINASHGYRRKGEASYIRISAVAEKQRAKHVTFVCYRHDVLEENNERETDAEWEIVAIKARVTKEEEPMDPYTMARNFLHMKGGTKGDFTAEEFAKSIVYWNNHCMTTGKPKWFKKLAGWFRGCMQQLREDFHRAGQECFDNLKNRKD